MAFRRNGILDEMVLDEMSCTRFVSLQKTCGGQNQNQNSLLVKRQTDNTTPGGGGGGAGGVLRNFLYT